MRSQIRAYLCLVCNDGALCDSTESSSQIEKTTIRSISLSFIYFVYSIIILLFILFNNKGENGAVENLDQASKENNSGNRIVDQNNDDLETKSKIFSVDYRERTDVQRAEMRAWAVLELARALALWDCDGVIFETGMGDSKLGWEWEV